MQLQPSVRIVPTYCGLKLMSASARSRKDSHAGSWYSKDAHKLDLQLSEWLSKASCDRRHSRAIISPHAGYDYSGPCAAFSYNQIDPSLIRRIFILGPSHYLGLNGKCALSEANTCKTPFYNLHIDDIIYNGLRQTGQFVDLLIADDETEHSLEMQFPYIAKVMNEYRDNFKIVPILVGSLSPQREEVYGRLLAPYLNEPENLFVVSSDFCHWGRRFQYTYYDQQKGDIWQSIQALDEEGMRIIERLDPTEFTAYLKRYGNTICGRHPIGVLLRTIEVLRTQSSNTVFDFKFVKYAQSEQCHSDRDSSVSYAAGCLSIQ